MYVDSQGVPLLVGVQVGAQSTVDGNALLRLLDRVAVELPRWRDGRMRERVLVTHGYPDEAELLASALDWRAGASAFWGRVESNLARDHVRIVLVADEVPEDVTRTVEFLDAQLRDVEIRAIEVSCSAPARSSRSCPGVPAVARSPGRRRLDQSCRHCPSARPWTRRPEPPCTGSTTPIAGWPSPRRAGTGCRPSRTPSSDSGR